MGEIKLKFLLDNEKSKWIKENLLPIIGLLNYPERGIPIKEYYYRSFHFALPLSRENLLNNLTRISQDPKSFIENQLKEFENIYSDFFSIGSITDLDYKYKTKYNEYPHPSDNCNGEKEYSEYFYKLQKELSDLSREELNKSLFNINEIFDFIISNAVTVYDLVYVFLLKKAFKKSALDDFYSFIWDAIDDLRTGFESINFEEEFIDYILTDDNSPLIDIFRKIYEIKDIKIFEKIYKFLPKHQKWFAIFTTHGFNSSSCGIWYNISFQKKLAKELVNKFDKINILEILKRKYDESKNSLFEKDEFPLFKHKDITYKFMYKYREKMFNEFKKLYEFEIINSEFESLEFLRQKRILKVDNEEIFLISEEKFNALYENLDNKEEERFIKNKTKLMRKWLGTKISISKMNATELKMKPEVSPHQIIKKADDHLLKQRIFETLETLNRGQENLMQGQLEIRRDIETSKLELLEKMNNTNIELNETMIKVRDIVLAKININISENHKLNTQILSELSNLDRFENIIQMEDLSLRTYNLLKSVSDITTESIETLNGLKKNSNAITNIILGQLIEAKLGFDRARESGMQIMVGEYYNITLTIRTNVAFQLTQLNVNKLPLDAIISNEKVRFDELASDNYRFIPPKPLFLKTGLNEVASIDIWGPESGRYGLFLRMDGIIELNSSKFAVQSFAGPYEIERDTKLKYIKDNVIKFLKFGLNYKESLSDFLKGLLNK